MPTMNAPTVLLMGLTVGAVGAARADAIEPVPKPIESCVSSAAIVFASTDQHVTLEPADAQRVHDEMVRRYPVLQQHGFPVSRIVLWHKAGGESVFITLLDHPSKADEACFTATFSAARFDGIAELKRKYLRPELST
jgi:hypothetical protein